MTIRGHGRLIIGLAALAALLGACATGPGHPLYSPIATAGTFGYVDEQRSAKEFRVAYIAPTEFGAIYYGARKEEAQARNLALAYDMALRRAAELAIANGYPGFVVKRRDNDVNVQVYDDILGDPYLGGWPASRYRFPYYYPGPYRYRRGQMRIMVALEVTMVEEADGEAFDAKSLIERLEAKYREPADGQN